MYDSTMANKEGPSSTVKDGGEVTPVIQTLNVVSQKVIQVDTSRYYGDKKKIKISIYQLRLY